MARKIAPLYWILRIDPEFHQWLRELPDNERIKVKSVLEAIQDSEAMPWDYFERGVTVTQNIDDVSAIHQLHIRCSKRDLEIIFTVVRRNLLFIDFGSLREIQQRSILQTIEKRLPVLMAGLKAALKKEAGYV